MNNVYYNPDIQYTGEVLPEALMKHNNGSMVNPYIGWCSLEMDYKSFNLKEEYSAEQVIDTLIKFVSDLILTGEDFLTNLENIYKTANETALSKIVTYVYELYIKDLTELFLLDLTGYRDNQLTTHNEEMYYFAVDARDVFLKEIDDANVYLHYCKFMANHLAPTIRYKSYLTDRVRRSMHKTDNGELWVSLPVLRYTLNLLVSSKLNNVVSKLDNNDYKELLNTISTCTPLKNTLSGLRLLKVYHRNGSPSYVSNVKSMYLMYTYRNKLIEVK